jgi:hypothetical protein
MTPERNLITCQEGKKVAGKRIWAKGGGNLSDVRAGLGLRPGSSRPDNAVPEIVRLTSPGSALGKEFVLFDYRGHGHFAIGGAVLDPYHAAFALHPDTLRERDFGRERESEADRGSTFDG